MPWSGEPDTLTEGFLAHRDVLADQIVASAGAEIDQATHSMVDRRELGAQDFAYRVNTGGTNFDLVRPKKLERPKACSAKLGR